ncbi:hypothetical protein PHYBOEH_002965 [Phytophthora boehmeriae]|uniref:HP domain-containing protein n=1 Tax=Phytophthora boehmeriae TaxID=109152 RepID=A0A8T1X4I1_9STRA|nr:hypothetical protein PHYBOEH_002965 [Phytophthora boehmeriae]
MSTDSAFNGAGQKPGLEAWRIEDLKPVPVPANEQHKLHSGDSYIFLKTSEASSGLSWHIHFWLGKETTTDESGVAAYKTVELDDVLGGVPVQHRECQGHESALFLSYFKATGLQYLEGGVASGFNEVKRDEYTTTLYQIKGKRTVRVEQVPLKSSSLSVDDVFVLDAGLELYLYAGKEANRLEKAKALEFVRSTKEDRGGRANITFIDEEPENQAFWDALGGFETVTRSGESDEHHESQAKKNTTVLRVSESSSDLQVEDVTPSSGVLTKDILKSEDAFIIDVGNEVFVWVGSDASDNERKNALTIAVNYLRKQGRKEHTPITRVVEEGEIPVFTALFKAWTEPKVLEFGYQPSQGVAKTQTDKPVDVKSLFLTRAQSEENIGVDTTGAGEHDVKVWRIEDMEKVEVPETQYGHFFGGDSYIVLHTVTPSSGKPSQVIYFWQGRSSTTDEKAASALLATFMDDSLGGSPVQVRVVQGKEPAHFRALFKGTMIVHSGGKGSGFANRDDEDWYDTDGVSLYQIKGTNEENTVAIQVEEKAASLSSGDCFVLETPNSVYVWQGAGSSPAEREIASNIASILKKTREVEEVEEGNESDEFWEFVGGKAEYAKTKGSFEAPHEPRLFQCSNAYGYFDAHEIVNFAQDDLNTEDVFLLDTYTTLYVWIGCGANDKERREAMNLAHKYLEVAKSDGRGAGTPIVAVHCGNEPLLFTGNFVGWDSEFFSKSEFLDPYEAKLKKLKEEKEKNAPKDLPGTITNEQFREETPAPAPVAARAVPVLPTEVPSPVKAASPKAAPSPQKIASPKAAPSPQKVASPTAKATGSSGETFTYEQLKEGVEGIDITVKENYLSDAEFQTVMEMSKDEFAELPKWKQQAKKKSVGLF